jgi:hypothetical protein
MRAASKVSEYWYINSSSGSDLANAHTSLDSAGNIYTSAANGLFKYNSSGTIQYQGYYSVLNAFAYLFFVFDSSGYGYTLDTNTGIVIKFNASTSAFVWARQLKYSGASSGAVLKICIDSSDNFYVLTSVASNSFAILSFNTSGTVLWSKNFTTTLTSNPNLMEYANGFLYVSGQYNSRAWICKVDTSGSVIWSYILNTASTARFLTTKGSNLALSYSVGVTNGGIVKMTDGGSSPSIDWQIAYGAYTFGDLVFDASGNVYGSTRRSGGVYRLSKYNTSGTQQWCNSFTSNTGTSTDANFLIDSSGRLLVSSIGVPAPANTRFGFARVPNDGSKTGTYSAGGSTFTWASSTESTSAASFSLTATATVTVANLPALTLSTVTSVSFTTTTNTIVRTNIN